MVIPPPKPIRLDDQPQPVRRSTRLLSTAFILTAGAAVGFQVNPQFCSGTHRSPAPMTAPTDAGPQADSPQASTTAAPDPTNAEPVAPLAPGETPPVQSTHETESRPPAENPRPDDPTASDAGAPPIP